MKSFRGISSWRSPSPPVPPQKEKFRGSSLQQLRLEIEDLKIDRQRSQKIFIQERCCCEITAQMSLSHTYSILQQEKKISFLIFLLFSSLFFSGVPLFSFLSLTDWMICKTFFPVIEPWTWATRVDFLDSSIKTPCTVKSPQDFLQLEWFFTQLSHKLLRSIKLCLPICSKVFPLNWRLGIHGGIWCWCCEAHFIPALLQLSQSWKSPC